MFIKSMKKNLLKTTIRVRNSMNNKAKESATARAQKQNAFELIRLFAEVFVRLRKNTPNTNKFPIKPNVTSIHGMTDWIPRIL
jgi:hypothetical protein